MKIGEYEQMMSYLTRPGFKDGSPLVPEPKPLTAEEFKSKADLLIKGALGGFPKDEMITKLQEQLNKVQESGTMSKEEAINFINERTQQLREFIKENPGETLPGLDRENFKDGTPSKFAAPKSAETRGKNTSDKLQNFVKNYKETKGTTPTIMEIAKGTKASTTSVRKYLKEGEDFKITSFIESGKKAGAASAAKKNTGVSKVDEKAFKELKDITKNIKGISVQTTGTKSKSAGLRIGKQYQEIMDQFLGGQPTKYFPADREGIQKLKNLATEIANSEVYAKNVTPFLTSEEKLAVKRAKAASYKEKDPFNVYRKLQEYKTEKFPGVSREIQIQHGQPKFTTQTLSRMGLIPQDVNVSKDVENVERIRNNALKILNSKLNNKNRSVENKKQLIEEFNNTMKGLRGQLKGTPAQGLVNFELFDIDKGGNVTKLKDTGFNPKKGLAYGDELGELDLSKITKEQADEIIALGKKKIDLDLLQKTIPGVTTTDKIKRPESAKTRDMIKDFEIRTGPTLGMNLGLGKAAKTGLEVLGSPATAATFAGMRIKEQLGQGKSVPDVLTDPLTGAELLFPEISKKALPGVMSGVLGLGKVGRMMTPIGVGMTGIGILKERAKAMMAATPYQEDLLEDFAAKQYRGYELGGRVGFADGPDDPSKRKFMKIMGGLASLPIVGKFIKPAAKVAPAALEAAKGMPEWFGALVDKVIRKGTDMTKSLGYKDRQEVYGTKISNDEMVIVYKDLDDGSVRVEYQSPENMGEASVDLTYKPSQSTEDGMIPAEFKAVEAEPRNIRSGPDDYDIEFDGENVVENVDDLMSDTTKLKSFATDKTPSQKEMMYSITKRDRVEALNNDTIEQAEYLDTKYGPGDFFDEYD